MVNDRITTNIDSITIKHLTHSDYGFVYDTQLSASTIELVHLLGMSALLVGWGWNLRLDRVLI